MNSNLQIFWGVGKGVEKYKGNGLAKTQRREMYDLKRMILYNQLNLCVFARDNLLGKINPDKANDKRNL